MTVNTRRGRLRTRRGSLILAATLASAPIAFAAEPPVRGPAPAEVEDDAPVATNTVAPVTVTARRPAQPGAVVGDIKPELQLSPSDIQSYGVSTVTELLSELSPETRSDRGRGGGSPVVLLNGRRISGFNEIQNIPTEAILRVDILPEEVSLMYGYTADQRVVNIVLRRRFRATTGELQAGAATEGGRETGQAEVDLLHIRGDNRLNLDLKYTGASALSEAARGLVEPQTPFALGGDVVSPTAGAPIDPGLSALVGAPVTVAGVPAAAAARPLTLGDFTGAVNTTALGEDRTLAPATQALTANAVLARPIAGGFNATVNATLGATLSQSLQGLPTLTLAVPAGDPFSPFAEPVVVDRYAGAQGPLQQTTAGWTAHLGSTLNRDLGDWRLSVTDAYDHADTQTDTDVGVDASALQALIDAGSPAANPFAPLPALAASPQTTARSVTDSTNVNVLANGPLFDVPAGQVYVSAKTGDTQSWLAATSLREGAFEASDLSRNDFNAQVNVDLPLASRAHHVLGALGELSISLNATVDQLSDFGTLKAFGYGLNWTPVPGYNFIVSHTNDQAAPTIQQLGGPQIVTPGVRVFDYATGRTVDVTQIGGGQSNLSNDNRNVFKIGLTFKPFVEQNFTFVANYVKADIDHAIETFPAADAAIEAAFPSRFVRDASGDLVQEDLRPIDFTRAERAELRYGFNYARPFGPQPPPRPRRFGGDGAGPAGERRDADRAGPREGEGRARGGGGGGGPGGGRGSFGGAPAAGRLQFAVYHTVIFTDRMLVRPDGPILDLLNGSAASNTGGQYRDEVEAQAGLTFNGFGARLSADWRSSTFVEGGAGSSTGNLYFSDLTTINLRLFDNLGQQAGVVKLWPWLRGSRVTLNLNNLFDQRITVRDAAGVTPLSYQAGYIDPVGRTITLGVRKLFF